MSKDFKYHYIVGIALKDITFEEPPEFYMKYFYRFTSEELEKFGFAIKMFKNKLWKTDLKTSLETTGSSSMNSSLFSMMTAARINKASLHHFIMEDEVPEEWFENLPHSDYGKKLLKDSKI